MNETGGIDTYFLRITGSVNIPVPLDIDTDYAFVGNISVYKDEKGSNQNGTYNHIFKAQFTDGLQLIKGDQTVLAKSKLSQSQMLRKDCREEDVDYDRFMTFLRHPDLLRELFDRFEKV
jgi:hypothetical protein